MPDVVFVDYFDDEPDLAGLDMRTRAGHEGEVLRKVQLDGGFTVFWVCENLKRAYAATRLEERGEIVRQAGDTFPQCSYRIGGADA